MHTFGGDVTAHGVVNGISLCSDNFTLLIMLKSRFEPSAQCRPIGIASSVVGISEASPSLKNEGNGKLSWPHYSMAKRLLRLVCLTRFAAEVYMTHVYACELQYVTRS